MLTGEMRLNIVKTRLTAGILPLNRFHCLFSYRCWGCAQGPQGRVAAVLLAASLTIILLCGCTPRTEDSAVTEADRPSEAQQLHTAIEVGDWKTAEKVADAALIADPEDPQVLTDVAIVMAKRGQKRDAAAMLVSAAANADFQPISRVTFAMQALIEVGDIYPAIDLLKAVLQKHPEQHELRRNLVGFLAEAQRFDLLPEYLQQLIKDRQFDTALLIATSETSARRLSDKTANTMFERNPEDHRIRLALAFIALYRHDADKAAGILEDILERHPKFAPAHAMYGQALVGQARWKELSEWAKRAPAGTDRYANYWLTLGDAANESGQLPAAVRCYWQATQREPDNQTAWDRLQFSANELIASEGSGRPLVTKKQLDVITQYARTLHRFREHFIDFTAHKYTSQREATLVADDLNQLGRVWEAEAWSAIASTLTEDTTSDLGKVRQRILGRLKSAPKWYASNTPGLSLDFSSLPSYQWKDGWTAPQTASLIPRVAHNDDLRLTPSGKQWGLQGIGSKNNPTNARLAALIRSTGVGGASLDFDLDGWPDFFMVNAGGTMLQDDSQPNDLMRNLGDVFERVSPIAGVMDRRFGQGAAVGDFNEDGFPDLFIGNLGSNQLLRNNGDGTFSDCSELLQADLRKSWSTSAAFADLDGDAIADLFVTNYCQTVPNLDKACPNADGELGPCHPLKFPGDKDIVFKQQADGAFVDSTKKWIDNIPLGRGLGIVAGMLTPGEFGVFVANDMSRNAFYTRDAKDSSMRLINSADARGVAVDGLSRSQASMGIASGDFDHDGDLDFYVTGFAREYNAYYEQVSGGLWKDRTTKMELARPTLTMVGFGSEAIDIDSDGIDELMVTNGNIGDFKPDSESPPYELPLQIFRRGKTGSFALIEDDPWGEYFRKPHVGRALWTTDVNRDGLNDVFITHVYEQVCLLINESRDNNHRIGFQLAATNCSRSAVGAVIGFRAGDRQRKLWMLSGDGYFCSNEKTLIAGLGSIKQVDDVTVTWQDGSVDQLGTLQADQLFLIVQGSGEAFSMHDYQQSN